MVDAIETPLALKTDGQLTPFTPIDSLLYARQGISGGVFGGGGGVDVRRTWTPGRGRPPTGAASQRAGLGPNRHHLPGLSALALMRAGRTVRAPAARPFSLKRYRNAPS